MFQRPHRPTVEERHACRHVHAWSEQGAPGRVNAGPATSTQHAGTSSMLLLDTATYGVVVSIPKLLRAIATNSPSGCTQFKKVVRSMRDHAGSAGL